MKYFGEGLSDLHKELNTVIRKKDGTAAAKQLFAALHSRLHSSKVYGTGENEVDLLLADLLPHEYRIMPTAKDETIAWALWHIARIEDLTLNFLVVGSSQVFDTAWKKRLNTPIADTGNALSDDEIIDFSRLIDIEALKAYRNAVGKRTNEIVKSLSAADMKRKVSREGLNGIRQAGGVTEQEDSLWLLDFWANKDIAGILLMPPTRHVISHLNDCCKWKAHLRAGKKCFLKA